MTGKELREALRNGRRVYGTLTSAPSPVWPGAARQAGLDFVFIDTEHMPLDRFTVSWMCRMYREMDLPPIVRIPSPDPYEACKILDGGAAGIIVPYVESVEQVRDLVGAARLRPVKGKRLAEALADPDTLEPELRRYVGERNAGTVALINVESVPALENLDALLAVPELDGVVVGPHDLSCSLGVPEQYTAPRFEEAMQTIIRKGRAAGVGVGVHYSEGTDLEIQWAKSGLNMIIHAGDISLFSRALQTDIASLRRALGDVPSGLGEDETLIV